MGTIKISEADKSYIENFLKYDDKNIDKDWIVGASIGNIGVLGAAVYFLESKIIGGILCSIISLFILLSLINFLKKIEHNKKNLYLYYGIYTTLWVVSCCICSYALLKRIIGNKVYWVVLAIIILSFFVAIMTIYVYKKNITRNYYRYKKMRAPVSVAAIMCGIITVRKLELDRYLLLGICFTGLAITSAGNIYFLIKYYCYCLLDKIKIGKK